MRRRGFTLIELVLVMVVFCVTMALVAPSLRGFLAGRALDEAAGELVAVMELARSRAAAEGATVRLNIDPAAGVYWLTRQDDYGEFVEMEDAWGRPLALPEDARVAGGEGDETITIDFYADGRCQVATVEVQGSDGQVVQVAAASATERYRVQ